MIQQATPGPMMMRELLLAYGDRRADQPLQDHSEQEGIHAFRAMMVLTSPVGGIFELRFTNLSLSSRRTVLACPAEGPSPESLLRRRGRPYGIG